jgi:hypothetical protein
VHAHPQRAGATGSKLTLAQIFSRHGAAFRSANRLVPVQHRAMRAIQACRTEALGGHIARCEACGQVRYHYHSCRNRHCPKCQTLAKERWLERRRAELLPVPYFHLVFTLPHTLNALAQGNPRVIYALLFESVSATLLEFGHNPRWLGGDIAATLVLHTWGQTLTQHVHVHCLIAAGALGANGQWVHARRGFLFPVKALSPVFRGKFLAGLVRALDADRVELEGSTLALREPVARGELFAKLRAQSWVVYAKPSFGGPENVLDYLGRYTHRVAISDHRLVSLSDTAVRFGYKDYANANRRKVMALDPAEFIRRFLLHVLPSAFMRIRHYGLLANRVKRDKLAAARIALGHQPVVQPRQPESLEAFWLRVAGLDVHLCAHCHTGRMVVIAAVLPALARAPPLLRVS